jgi:hypothetical protein
MRAEILQWQAAIATVEAEKSRKFPGSKPLHPPASQADQAPVSQLAMATSQRFYPPSVSSGTVPQMSGEPYDDEDSEITESGEEGEGDNTWTGFDDMEPTIKPPL